MNAAACMTWELAESGSSFVTTVINGSDLVPSFCAASLDDLRAEVYMPPLMLKSQIDHYDGTLGWYLITCMYEYR